MLRTFDISDEKQREKLEEEIGTAHKAKYALDTHLQTAVKNIIHSVTEKGDKALLELTKRFDGVDLSSDGLKVKEAEFTSSEKQVSEEFKKAFSRARENIYQYHLRQKPRNDWETEKENSDFFYGENFYPLESVGAYIPGGTAPLVSTLLMICIPARIAGVSFIRVTTPPRPDGTIDPHILYACLLLGIKDVYKVGGAQAVAALAFGTETIKCVDKVCGPGNKYVTEAKRQVFGYTGIDMLAGPSEVCVIADKTAQPDFVAADILSQAEHDPESRAILITDSAELAKKVEHSLHRLLSEAARKKILEQSLKKGFIVITESIDQAYNIVRDVAPEHLQIMVSHAEKLKTGNFFAGAVFLGDYTPVVAGDLFAGPNHVLPTNRRARFSSPLGVYDFMRRSSRLYYSKKKLSETAEDIMLLADTEQLPCHKNSIAIRRGKAAETGEISHD
jgi:histidinol dehydrogenase